MRDIVIDASVAAAWLLPDERSEATDTILRDLGSTTAVVPSIFWHEVRNILLMAERRKRLGPVQARVLMAKLDLLGLRDAGHGNSDAVLALTTTHALTAYDAVHLALAILRRCALATLDTRLAEAARLCELPLLPAAFTP